MIVQGKIEKVIHRWDKAWTNFVDVAETIPAAKRGTIPEGGGWSAKQVMYHLYLSEQKASQYVQKKSSDPTALRAVPLLNLYRLWLLKWSMALPLRFKAPTVVSDLTTGDSISWDELKLNLKESHHEILEMVEALPQSLDNKGVFRHPVIGLLTIPQMFHFFTMHIRHHIHQIKRIKQSIQ